MPHRILLPLVVFLLVPGGEVRAQFCYPARITQSRVSFYWEKSDGREAGMIKRGDDGELKLCRVEGDWARVRLDTTHYWMKARDVAVGAEDAEFVRMELPGNGADLYQREWCNEAVTREEDTILFVTQHGVVDDAVFLPRWTPILACGRQGRWHDVQHDNLAGLVETSALVISPARRERDVGFGTERRAVCKGLSWKGRTVRDTAMYRWERSERPVKYTIAAREDVDVVDSTGKWLWCGFLGRWGHILKEDVDLRPTMFETTETASMLNDCGGTYERSIASRPLTMLMTPEGGAEISVIPPPMEFAVLERAVTGAMKVFYLGKVGWIEGEGVGGLSEPSSLAVRTVEGEIDARTLTDSIRAGWARGWTWEARARFGAAGSDDLPAAGGTFEGAIGVRVAKPLALTGGFFAYISDSLLIVGPELGLSAQWEVDRKTGTMVDLGVSSGVHRAAEAGLGLGGRAGVALGFPLVRPYSVLVGYAFRWDWIGYCAGGADCPRTWLLMHGIQAGVAARF